MAKKVYADAKSALDGLVFDDGPGGWLGWISNAEGALRLETQQSAVVSRSPWWIAVVRWRRRLKSWLGCKRSRE